MVVYPLAGERFRGDLSRFIELGITIDYTGNVKFMQVAIAGSAAFIREWINQKMGIIRKILEGIRGLSKRQVALYLLRKAGHGCRVIYYLRTIPREMIEEFINEFDEELRVTFQAGVGLVLDETQWEQASYKTKQSGVGLCRATDVADAAYLASRGSTFEDCQALDRRHVWDDGAPRGMVMLMSLGNDCFLASLVLTGLFRTNRNSYLGKSQRGLSSRGFLWN